MGLALAILPLEEQALRTGRLVQPFAVKSKYDHDLYGVYRSEDKDRHDIQCFLNWLEQAIDNK